MLTIYCPGVSCGIPDFRSQNGIYASLKEKGEYELDDPQQMYALEFVALNNHFYCLYAILKVRYTIF